LPPRAFSLVTSVKRSVAVIHVTDWLKVKNRTYSQAEGRHELLTRGR